MAESDVECRLVALNANEWMQASLQQPSGFAHEFACEQKASRLAVPARLLLSISQLDEGLCSRVLDEEFSDDFCTVVGDGGFPVGFVQHFVQALRAKRPLHQVTEGDRRSDEFWVTPTPLVTDVVGRTMATGARPLPSLPPAMNKEAGPLVFQPLSGQNHFFLAGDFFAAGFLACFPILCSF